MSKEELREKLREETERSEKNAKRRAAQQNSRKQQKIAEQTKKQLPPQSPARKRREEEARRRAEIEMREKKRHHRRGSNVVYYVILAVLAVITFSILSVTVLFNTEQIIVEGESDYTDEQIIAASGLVGDENLVKLNLSGLPERMLDKLVTLDSVRVDKVFPDTIKITVTPSVPMASFIYGGKSYVISHIGRVMYIEDEDEHECMRIIGYKPAESVIIGGFIKAEDEEQDMLVQEISAAIEKAEIEDITTVNISDNINIILSYQDRVEIKLGSILQIDEKMRVIYELLYNGHIADTEYVTLDVTNPSRTIQRPITTAPITAAPEETSETEEGEDGDTTNAPEDSSEPVSG